MSVYPQPKKTLYGTYSDKCCGYCKLHHVSITVQQMKKKKCLKKVCRHFRKYPNHPYWVQREREKEKKKANKLAKKERLKALSNSSQPPEDKFHT